MTADQYTQPPVHGPRPSISYCCHQSYDLRKILLPRK